VITREDASRIAQQAAIERKLGAAIAQVLRLEEMEFRRPSIYNHSLDGCWIAYVEHTSFQMQASTIVVINDQTGAVVYAGSANDEG